MPYQLLAVEGPPCHGPCMSKARARQPAAEAKIVRTISGRRTLELINACDTHIGRLSELWR